MKTQTADWIALQKLGSLPAELLVTAQLSANDEQEAMVIGWDAPNGWYSARRGDAQDLLDSGSILLCEIAPSTIPFSWHSNA